MPAARQTSGLLALPDEILRDIFRHVCLFSRTPSLQLPLLGICHKLAPIVVDNMQTRIEIRGGAKLTALCYRLLRDPAFAARVSHLSVHIDYEPDTTTRELTQRVWNHMRRDGLRCFLRISGQHTVDAVWPALITTLHLCRNIESLVLDPTALIRDVGEGLRFDTIALQHALASLSRLRSFDMDGAWIPGPVFLESLQHSRDSLHAVTLRNIPDDLEEGWSPATAGFLAGVEHLRFACQAWSERTLRMFLEAPHQLQSLAIVILADTSVVSPSTWQSILTSVAPRLKLLTLDIWTEVREHEAGVDTLLDNDAIRFDALEVLRMPALLAGGLHMLKGLPASLTELEFQPSRSFPLAYLCSSISHRWPAFAYLAICRREVGLGIDESARRALGVGEDSFTFQMDIAFATPHTVLDLGLSRDAVHVLAVTQPLEWAMEPEANVVLAHRFDSEDGKATLKTLRGRGLPNEHGTGAWLARPRRLLPAADDHFLLVADRAPPAWRAPAGAGPGRDDDDGCLACDDHGGAFVAPGPSGDDLSQIVVYKVEGDVAADAVHYLDQPAPVVRDLAEADLTVSSVQLLGDCVVGLVRWRDPEEILYVHRGRQGRSHFLDGGWRAVEAIAWDWRTGFICARFRIEAIQAEAPELILQTEDRLVIIVTNDDFEETTIYNLAEGGARFSSTLRATKDEDEGVEVGAPLGPRQVQCDLLDVKRLDLPCVDDAKPSLAGFVGDRFVAPSKGDLFVTEADLDAAEHTSSDDMASLLAQLPPLDACTMGETRLSAVHQRATSGYRAIYAIESTRAPLRALRPTTIFGAPPSVPHYAVDFRPDLRRPNQGQRVYRARCTRALASSERRSMARDSGIVAASDKPVAAATALEYGWTAVGIAEVRDERLRAALRRKRVWWEEGRIVCVDEGRLVVVGF